MWVVWWRGFWVRVEIRVGKMMVGMEVDDGLMRVGSKWNYFCLGNVVGLGGGVGG